MAKPVGMLTRQGDPVGNRPFPMLTSPLGKTNSFVMPPLHCRELHANLFGF